MARATSEGRISPRPTAANTSSIEARASRGSAPCSFSSEYSRLARWHSRSTMRRPSSAYCTRTASRVARRIASRALPVTTIDSQAAGGADLRLRGEDIDLVAVVELGHQRRDLAVDLAADRVVADVGVHRIGEIDRRRLARQRDQLALGREAEHLVVEQFELGVFEEFLRIGAFGQQLDGAAQPGIGVRFARQHLGRRAGAVLVERVRGDAVFGDLVHLLGADLQLDALLAGADHGGVDRAVVVLLGRRDVVLEAARHHRPGRVHDAERAVALRQRLRRSRGSRRCRRAARSRPTCAPSCARSNRAACAGPAPRRRCRNRRACA